MTMNLKDVGSGALFVAAGGFFFIYGLMDLNMGSAVRMGPGFFPAVCGALLTLLGLAIVVRGFLAGGEAISFAPPRAILLVTLAPILFGYVVTTLGLAPAALLTALAAVWASRKATLVKSVVIAAALAAFALAVLSYGLDLPIPLLRIGY